jgi:hypothetical protein
MMGMIKDNTRKVFLLSLLTISLARKIGGIRAIKTAEMHSIEKAIGTA